jgi:glycosyltransferase involved in cell wall biosynthesis
MEADMKLSVIIPVYNKLRYLSGLLEQVMEQTFRDFECLLIDDGSTDGSGVVCDEFAAKDPRFRVFHIPNGGVSHARNVGLDAARGEYITFIDSDDGIRPGYLENLVQCMEKSCADLVISGYEKVDADGIMLSAVIPETTGAVCFVDWLSDFGRVQLQTGLYGCCVAKLFPRALVQRIRFDESLRLAEDFDFYLNLYEVIETVFLDDHTDYLYLQEAENSTGNTASEKIDYLAQLRINLHYRSMFQKRGVWSGENRAIVEGRLSDYAFFVLFHTPMPHYRERFHTLYELCTAECMPLSGGNILRRWLFSCLRHRLYHIARLTITLYRLARKLLRR